MGALWVAANKSNYWPCLEIANPCRVSKEVMSSAGTKREKERFAMRPSWHSDSTMLIDCDTGRLLIRPASRSATSFSVQDSTTCFERSDASQWIGSICICEVGLSPGQLVHPCHWLSLTQQCTTLHCLFVPFLALFADELRCSMQMQLIVTIVSGTLFCHQPINLHHCIFSFFFFAFFLFTLIPLFYYFISPTLTSSKLIIQSRSI